MIALPNPFQSFAGIEPSQAETAVAPHAPPQASATAAAFTVSPGAFVGSLPSGESDPSVMLDCPPGENATDNIHEIFHFARKLLEDDKRGGIAMDELERRGFSIDEFLSDLEDRPLFLRVPIKERV